MAALTTPSAAAASTAPAPSFADFDRRARAGEPLSVVFFGASLTWGANSSDPNRTSYRGRLAARLEAAYPRARFHFWDAAIGGTGSQLAVFRLDRDVLARHPDLVFLDFSANDGIGAADPETLASYEAVVRRIITQGRALVVQMIFPFNDNIVQSGPDAFPRRAAHERIAAAYGCGVGDAISLVQQRVRAGQANRETLWPWDGAHPDDGGYALFAEAAWQGLAQAIGERRVCQAPPALLYADTYMTSRRALLTTLGALPAGWKAEPAGRTSAYFDMLMSRWLDGEAVASGPDAAPLRVSFTGSMALLFGESTPLSGSYEVRLDGGPAHTYDAGVPGVQAHGNTRLWQIVASGLSAHQTHTLTITPRLGMANGQPQELRLESVCVAGPGAAVHPAPAP